MDRIKKLKIWASVAIAVVVVLLVVTVLTKYDFYAATLKYGLIFFCILLVAFLVWKAFIKGGKEDLRRSEKRGDELAEEVSRLQKTVTDLSRELAEKSRTRLNVLDLKPIVHLAVLNLDTSFTRTYVRESEDGMVFNGALRADICAEYGIRLEDVRFCYDEEGNTLTVSNFHPGIISFSKKRLNWEIARSYRTPKFLGMELPAISGDVTDAFTKKMCETLRSELESEIDERGVAEFDWLGPMISAQLTDFLKILVGRESVQVLISEEEDGSFVDLPALRNQLLLEEGAREG